MKVLSEKSEAALGYLKEFPDAPLTEVAEACGISCSWVSRLARGLYGKKDGRREAKPVTKKAALQATESLRVSFEVPSKGITLKLSDPEVGVIGTLLVTRTGLKVLPANGKLVPERELTYSLLVRVHETGLF